MYSNTLKSYFHFLYSNSLSFWILELKTEYKCSKQTKFLQWVLPKTENKYWMLQPFFFRLIKQAIFSYLQSVFTSRQWFIFCLDACSYWNGQRFLTAIFKGFLYESMSILNTNLQIEKLRNQKVNWIGLKRLTEEIYLMVLYPSNQSRDIPIMVLSFKKSLPSFNYNLSYY